ncbi:MAG: methyl-accepting chemotaxis protein [Spirochaetia bacterium]
MTGKRFAHKFFSSEAVGFLFGAPVGAAYALLLTNVAEDKITDILQIIAVTTVVMVVFAALPINYLLIKNLKIKIDNLFSGKLEHDEYMPFFRELLRLPIVHGAAIFLRVAIGSVIVAGVMYFVLDVPLLQCIICCLLAWYGSFIAGLIAYIIIARLVRPIAQTIVASHALDQETIMQEKYFSLGYFSHAILFLIIPVIFTNLSIFLSFVASTSTENMDLELLKNKIFGVVVVNIITLSASILLNIFTTKTKIDNLDDSVSMFASKSGDLTHHSPTDIANEFGHIMYLMNMAIANFRRLIRKLQHTSSILSDSTRSMAVSTQEISSTANQQAASVKEIVSTMEDSNKMSKDIQTKIREVAKLSNQTRDYVDKGVETIQKNNSQMSTIQDQYTETIQGIKGLGEQIDSIWEIVGIINNIADQTKIIAFNAELEAASAGEAGKNFEIVASEIRRLADNTMSSTKQIRERITDIQKSSDKLVLVSQTGADTVDRGWDLTKQVEDAFHEILSSTEISSKAADQIATSIEQQTSSSEQILVTLKQISEGVNNFVNSTGSITEFSTKLKNLANELNEIVSKYKVDSEEEPKELIEKV